MFNRVRVVTSRLSARLNTRSASGLNNFEEFFASAKCDVVNNAPIMVHSDKMQHSHTNQSSNMIVTKNAALVSLSSTKDGTQEDGTAEGNETAIPPYSMDLQPTAKKHNLKISS